MKVLVCGGRDWCDTQEKINFINITLSKRFPFSDEYGSEQLPSDLVVIQGGARGVDRSAYIWAYDNGCHSKEYPANWDKYGKRAGYLRNKQMLEEGKPDLVIAFPGGVGTAMMVRIAREAGVPVEEVKYDEV